MTTQTFAAKHRVRIASELTDRNPHMTDMVAGSAHWRVTLKCGRRQMSLYYSQGPAIIHEPEAYEVLDCLASDASSAFQPFEDWCGDYGYDPDSRKAEATYRTIQKQAVQLSKLLGVDAYKTLLYNTERL